MSTRWYPLYQRGNPQLRVFLPNFWMKLVRQSVNHPPNMVEFIVSNQMTRMDIKNYLEKIYNIEVISVSTRIAMGATRRNPGRGYIVKDDDYKVAYVTLPRDVEFKFPDLFPENKKVEDDKKSLDESKKGFKNYLAKSSASPGSPGWFTF